MTDYGSHLDDPSYESRTIKEEQDPIDNENQNEEEDEEEDDNKDLLDDLFGSDDDDNENTNNKILSKEYKRSVPEGKKLSISTNLSLSTLPQSSDFEFCILRLPNVIGCETEEFDKKSYVEPSSTSSASSIDNYIRWRTHFDAAMAETFKESNTKLVYWKDGTKSLFIGKDCYDIDEQILSGNRDFIYAKLENATNNTSYKLCHGQFIKRLNVKAQSLQKSYKTLQKNLAKKHERTKGSKQLTAAQRRNNRTSKQSKQQQNNNKMGHGYGGKTRSKRKKINKKRSLRESYLEQGALGGSGSSDEEDWSSRRRKKLKTSDNSSSSSEQSDDEEDSNYSESESEEDEDDDQPIGNRL